MRVLVTGGSGWSGSFLCRYIAAVDPETELFSLDLRPGEGVGRSLVCDLTDPKAVSSRLAELRPDVILHLAGIVSAAPVEEYFRRNVLTTASLLEALRHQDMEARVLVIGSAAEYGRGIDNNGVCHEDAPPAPLDPYGSSKAAQTILALQYARAYDMPIVITRTFNLVGPDLSDRLVAGAFARQIAEVEAGISERPVRVGNLAPQRDFIDVRDAVRAYWALALQGKPGVVYNVASGRATPVGLLLNMLIRHSRVPIRVESDADRARPVDIAVQVGDIRRICQAIDWQPTIPLEQSLGDLLDSYRKRVESSSQG